MLRSIEFDQCQNPSLRGLFRIPVLLQRGLYNRNTGWTFSTNGGCGGQVINVNRYERQYFARKLGFVGGNRRSVAPQGHRVGADVTKNVASTARQSCGKLSVGRGA